MCGVLVEEKSAKAAFRYACCGLGDQLTRKGDEVFVSPKGCGHKLCPRCGRRRGGRYAKRIIGWLGEHEHGDLWQVVLTQPVIEGEPLAKARKRMAKKQRSYMRWLTRRGLVGAMTVVHCPWSSRSNGWHYHVHVLVEMPRGSMTVQELLTQWVKEGGEGEHRVGEKQARLVLSAGPAIAELKEDSGDADFWHESVSAVARSVQYPLRDLVQGIAAHRMGGDCGLMRECARELVKDAGGWKMFRAWGRWRKACVPAEVQKPDEPDAEGDSATPAPGPTPLGTVGRLWRAARKGDAAAREVFRLLEASLKNDSEFAVRLVRYCRLCRAGP